MIIEITNKMPDYIIVPSEILADDRLTLRQIRVLMAIFSLQKSSGSIDGISCKTLSEFTGYTQLDVQHTVSEVKSFGLLDNDWSCAE